MILLATRACCCLLVNRLKLADARGIVRTSASIQRYPRFLTMQFCPALRIYYPSIRKIGFPFSAGL
jgi:hypothetical protein